MLLALNVGLQQAGKYFVSKHVRRESIVTKMLSPDDEVVGAQIFLG